LLGWGRGSGYRDRVNDNNKRWFVTKRGNEADHRVEVMIHEEWKNAIAAVGQLMLGADPHGHIDAAA
jgi:hypothetical protein